MANLYKIFRSTGTNNTNVTGIYNVGQPNSTTGGGATAPVGNVLSKRYDEPTYMTFRVFFGQNGSNVSGTNLLNTDYDRMPHPLFINQKIDATQIQGDGMTVVNFNRDFYSTRDYLRDSNEFTRAEMLNEFITLWNNLQDNFQWYFQSIEGLQDLLTIVPERGKRVGQDVRLTFNMLESIDHRISYLLNLYKKIAWDDLYQRWVLPDIMRFFYIQILITEFRTFHQSTVQPNSDAPVYLQILDCILPTYLIQCEMCEFDINSFNYSYRQKVSVADEPEMTSLSFKVKVGNVNEITTYPLFTHFIMNDYKLNGNARSKETGNMKDLKGKNKGNMDSKDNYISTEDGDLRYNSLDQLAQDTYFQDNHTSERPFNESKSYYDNLNNSSPNYSINLSTVNPIEPATWVGNALKFGKSFAVNFVTQKIDKIKMTDILGFSFNDAVAAIESKDFISVLALIRRAIAESIGSSAPSSLLDKKIDKTFKEFLTGVSVSLSEATTPGTDALGFIRAANLALSEETAYKNIKDLSLATNMVGPGEVNIPVVIEGIEGKDTYKQSNLITSSSIATSEPLSKSSLTMAINATLNKSNLDTIKSLATSVTSRDLTGGKYVQINNKSLATSLDGLVKGMIIEAPPSSATSGKKVSGNQQTTSILSNGTTNIKVNENGPKTDIISESTNSPKIQESNLFGDGGLGNKIDENKFIDNEKSLGNKISGGKLTGDGGLGTKADGGKLIGKGGLGNEINQEGKLTGDGGLGTNVSKIELKGNGELGNKISKDELKGDGGLGNKVDKSGQLTGDGGLKNEIDEGGNLIGDGGLKNKIEENLQSTNIISEATSVKKIDKDTKPLPKVGKATDIGNELKQ